MSTTPAAVRVALHVGRCRRRLVDPGGCGLSCGASRAIAVGGLVFPGASVKVAQPRAGGFVVRSGAHSATAHWSLGAASCPEGHWFWGLTGWRLIPPNRTPEVTAPADRRRGAIHCARCGCRALQRAR